MRNFQSKADEPISLKVTSYDLAAISLWLNCKRELKKQNKLLRSTMHGLQKNKGRNRLVLIFVNFYSQLATQLSHQCTHWHRYSLSTYACTHRPRSGGWVRWGEEEGRARRGGGGEGKRERDWVRLNKNQPKLITLPTSDVAKITKERSYTRFFFCRGRGVWGVGEEGIHDVS